jgi:alpha-beta hydrolase superfamily lysophospholipase
MTLKLERRRDNQQWILDYLVKTTGRVVSFGQDTRVLPPEVRTHEMIPRVLEKQARHTENIARAAEQAGHGKTAAELYWNAADVYREAQHSIYEDGNPEKIYLHGKLLECFARMIPFADHPIEIVEIPFEGNFIQGVYHMLPGKPKAPSVLHLPGMDQTKESRVDPLHHPFVMRGLHCLQIDGPGQGTSNIRRIWLTEDNYPRAAQAALDWLCARKEVDAERLAISGYSFGSHWAMALAAMDKRVKAIATAAATYGPKTALFEKASPRSKQIGMYMANIHDEDAFDAFAARLVVDKFVPGVRCPALFCSGEYDDIAPLRDVVDIFRKVPGPKELWVVENGFHNPVGIPNFGGNPFFGMLADWLNDALAGRKAADLDRTVVIPVRGGAGPYTEPVRGIFLPERIGDAFEGLTAAQAGPAGVRKA